MTSSCYEKIVDTSPPRESNESKILCVGLICLDIIQVCNEFPTEDSDQRCVEHWWQRGGNASNNCTVLSQAGASCQFLGTLSSEEHLNFLKDDMQKYKINFSHCPTVEGIGCPVSTVILSLSTGTRTILHHNPNLPELSLEDFKKLNLEEYSWIHFEGRNVPAVLSMMKEIEAYNNSLKTALRNYNVSDLAPGLITVSVELEKPKEQLLDLLPYVDVAFIGRTFAEFRGYHNMSETLRSISRVAKSEATIICAWGDKGAMARAPDGTIVQSPAFPPRKVIDSLGAGDTFAAAIIFYLNKIKLSLNKKHFTVNKSPEEGVHSNQDAEFETNKVKQHVKQNYNIESLKQSHTEFIDGAILQSAVTFACKIAGAKIGLKGYNGLDKIFKDILRNELETKV